MVTSKQERIDFLKQRQLFKDLDTEVVNHIAEQCDEITLEPNQLIIHEGESGNAFFIIFKGSVRVWKKEKDNEIELAILENGDQFGEESLLFNRPRSASVETITSTTLFVLNEEIFNWLIKTYPETKLNLRAIADSHREARKQRFTWLQDAEVIYLISRRHKAELFLDLIKPFVIFIIALILYALGYFLRIIPQVQNIFAILSILFIVVGILSTFWEIIDWQNDYFIITNQRVIWLEQILLQSASRQEAPMSAIQSVNIETSQIGRILGFGNISIRTFTGTGSLYLTNVNNPYHFRDNIEELLLRVRKKTETAKSDRMRQAIRESIGLDAGKKIKTDVGLIDPETDIIKGFSLLKIREVLGDTIIYHKHWWVLGKKIWLPTIIAFGLLLGLLWFSLSGSVISLQLVCIISIPGIIGFSLFLAYHYLDWKNDLYKVTHDTIIDSEKKPLGQETTKSAPIKNIQSMEHTRSGLLRILMNFGTVTINVADAQLIFNDIYNPSQALQDIFYRQERLKFEEEEGGLERERKHMADWMAAYHDVWESEQDRQESSEENNDDDNDEFEEIFE